MPKRRRCSTGEEEGEEPELELGDEEEEDKGDDDEGSGEDEEGSGEDDDEEDDDEEDDDEEDEDEGEEAEENNDDEPKKKKRAKKGEGKNRPLYKQFDLPQQQLQFLVEKSAFVEFKETETDYVVKPTAKAMLPKYKNWFKNKASVFKQNRFEPESEGSKVYKRPKSLGLIDPVTFIAVGETPVLAKDSRRFAFE